MLGIIISPRMQELSICQVRPWVCIPDLVYIFLIHIPVFIVVLTFSMVISAVNGKSVVKKNKTVNSDKFFKKRLIIIFVICIVSIVTFHFIRLIVMTNNNFNKSALICEFRIWPPECYISAALEALPKSNAQGKVDYSKAHAICNLSYGELDNSRACKIDICERMYWNTWYVENIPQAIRSHEIQLCKQQVTALP